MKILKSILIGIYVTTSLSIRAQPGPVDVFEQNRRLGRGVNIIGYDPIWRSREPRAVSNPAFPTAQTSRVQFGANQSPSVPRDDCH